MEYIGADEQKTSAIPFMEYISPTDLEATAYEISDVIAQHHSMDWINPTMWRIVGYADSGIIEFLKRYMLAARQWKVPLNSLTLGRYRQHFINEYGYREGDIDEILSAFLQVNDAGLIPDSIYTPWTYQSTTLAEDIGEAAAKATKSIVPMLALVAVAGVAAYAFFSKGVVGIATK